MQPSRLLLDEWKKKEPVPRDGGLTQWWSACSKTLGPIPRPTKQAETKQWQQRTHKEETNLCHSS